MVSATGGGGGELGLSGGVGSSSAIDEREAEERERKVTGTM